MATRFELVLDGEDEGRLRAVGEAALEAIEECELTISPFLPGSLLSRVNARAAEEWVAVDADTFTLLETARQVRRESLGAFDVTVAPVMAALGFRGDAGGDLATARRAVGGDALLLDPECSAVRFARPGLGLDVGGIGKGHALELAREVLVEHGITRALLHGGTSSVLALGAPAGADAWRVALGPEAEAPLALLRDAALSVSVTDGRTAALGDGSPVSGHVVDPQSGRALADGIAAAVIDTDARRADARSTALCVTDAGVRSAPQPLLAAARAERAAGTLCWDRVEGPADGPNRFELRSHSPQTLASTA
ncbi:MAG: FAD:protein FMN transferase [Planctomycetota bacterium]|jgi:thiamine biosynthesis lipoprotein|nr:FAD:protein FMN transferase [Planctomycetota bacterium]MDP6762445.1 FAD:protein FMN transferase [Planctomycetota bacterium]